MYWRPKKVFFESLGFADMFRPFFLSPSCWKLCYQNVRDKGRKSKGRILTGNRWDRLITKSFTSESLPGARPGFRLAFEQTALFSSLNRKWITDNLVFPEE